MARSEGVGKWGVLKGIPGALGLEKEDKEINLGGLGFSGEREFHRASLRGRELRGWTERKEKDSCRPWGFL